MTTKRCLPLLLATLLLSGCVTVTNLTPSQQRRSPDGQQPFAVAWQSKQKSLIKDSIKAYVMIDFDLFPLEASPVKDRWEGMVPVPADRKIVLYRYKFDYDYHSIPRPRTSSKLSPTYQLEILDK